MGAASGALVGRARELEPWRAGSTRRAPASGRLVLCAGEPGIGKTRLAQELAGPGPRRAARPSPGGAASEATGAPAFWPWRQVLRSLGADADTVLAGDVESPEDRFRVFDDVVAALRAAGGRRSGLVVILDDIHWGDEPRCDVLRHLADGDRRGPAAAGRRLPRRRPGQPAPAVLPDLLRSPGAERLDLRGFGLAEVRDQLGTGATADATDDATARPSSTSRAGTRCSSARSPGRWPTARGGRTGRRAPCSTSSRARLDRVSGPSAGGSCRPRPSSGVTSRSPLVAAALDEPVGGVPPVARRGASRTAWSTGSATPASTASSTP